MGFAGSTVSFAPTVRATLHALRRWLDGGAPPPHQPRFQREGDTRVLARDEHGNALGGIRWPDLEAPLGTHVGENLTDNIANVGGSSTPFPPEKVKALYPDHAAWFAKYQAAVEQLVKSEVVLPDDAAEMLARAAALDLPDRRTAATGVPGRLADSGSSSVAGPKSAPAATVARLVSSFSYFQRIPADRGRTDRRSSDRVCDDHVDDVVHALGSGRR